jgi:hypothetical protein
MANHNLPTLTSTYANFVTEMDARMDDISIGFDPALTTATNIATGTIRWVSASSKWEKWSGVSWADLASTYAINISGAATTANQLTTARTINGVSFNGSANISINLNNALTINNAGTGVASGSTFNGSAAITISYNTVGAPSVSGANATGTWGISITGNAGTATSATSATSAGSVTNGVYTVGDQTIAGVKTFSNQIRVSSGSATVPSISFNADGSTDTGIYWTADGYTNFTNNGVYSGHIAPGGNFLIVGNVTAYGSTTVPSDIRIKTGILKIEDALNKVMQLTGITYDRTDISTSRQTGLIAQEVQKVLPEAIITLSDEQKTLTVAYGNMLGLLVEAIKELKAEVDQLKAKS